MFPLFARGCRPAGSSGLVAASILAVSVLVGTAAAQDTPPDRMPVADREPDADQIRQLFEDAIRNTRGRSNLPNAVKVKKTVRAVEDGANGALAVVIIAVGLIGLLVGLYVLRRMARGLHTSRPSALDDPCVRAYMLALEGKKPEVGSQKTEVGSQTAEDRSQKTEGRSQKSGLGSLKTAVAERR